MPEVFLNDGIDITNYASTISWRGGKTEVARRLEIGTLNSVLDKFTTNLYINNGSLLKLIDNDKVLFEGFVFFNDKSSKASAVYVTAYDRLIYLLKSKEVYNFKNKTADDITKLICNQFKIPIGSIAKTGVTQSFIANRKSLYDIIMQAYTGASSVTGKKYMLRMLDGKLNVVEVGAVTSTFLLSDESNIIDSGYSESIENMVNRVKIYDDKQNYVGVVENTEWIKKYGVLQGVYNKEKDKNAQIEAKALLEGIRTDITVEALGNIEYVTGNGVHVKDIATGLTGLFYIESDNHTWQNGQHIVRLILKFEKFMDERK